MSSKCETTGFDSLSGDFLDAMRRVASTVSIITVAGPADRWLGMTATSVTSVAMEPPSLLVCLNRRGGTHDVVKQVGRFCVNVLSEGQADQCARVVVVLPQLRLQPAHIAVFRLPITHQRIDEQPVAHGSRYTPRGCVRCGDETHVLQVRHDIADCRRAEIETRIL